MDPLSAIASITGTIAVGLHTAQILVSFLNSIKDAPTEVNEVSKEVEAVSDVLTTLEKLRRAGAIRPVIAQSLTDSTKNCIDCMGQLKDQIQPYAKPAGDNKFKWRYVGWTLKKTSIKEFKDRLQQAKLTLSLSISIINTYAVETGNTEIRNDIGGLRQQLKAYDADKVDLASLRGGAPGSVAGTDAGLPLRRYLEHLSLDTQDWVNVDVNNAGDVMSNDALASDQDIDSPAGMRLGTPYELTSIGLDDDFFQAVLSDDFVSIKERAAKGFDISKPCPDGRTPLHICALQNLARTAQVLIDAGADLDALDASKPPRSALWCALDSQSMGVAGLLIKNGQDPGPFVLEMLPKTLDATSSLHVQRAREESRRKRAAVYELLALTQPRKAVVDRIAAALMPSAENRDWSQSDGDEELRVSVMSEVLTSGLHPDEKDEPGFTALHYAAFAQQVEVVHLLLRHRAVPDLLTPRKAHMEPDAAGLGISALQIAAGSGNVPLINAIIEGGADVNLIDSTGGNALQAVGIFPPDVARTLLDAGADIENCKHDGYTILHWAVACCNAPLVDFLVQRGLDVDVGTRVHTRGLHLAASYGYVDVVKALLRNGATVNALDLYARTALHEAAREGHVKIGRILIGHGALSYYDTTNETPYMVAKFEGHDDFAAYLESVGQGEMAETSKRPGFVEEVVDETEEPQEMEPTKAMGHQVSKRDVPADAPFSRTQNKGHNVPAKRPTY